MDKLKELSARLGGKIKSINNFNVNLGETSFKKIIIKDYRQYKIEIDEYKDAVLLGVKVDSHLALSVNKPDRIFSYNIPKHLPGMPYKIFVSDEKYNFEQNEYVKEFWSSFSNLLRRISLSETESIFLYNNYVFFFLAAERDIVSELDGIIDLINANNNIFKRQSIRSISSKGVPESLKPLIPLLKKYSISDDAEREQLIMEMKQKEKVKLINSVQPFFEEINAYLDSFKENPLSEEAILIGDLAQLVSELKIRNND